MAKRETVTKKRWALLDRESKDVTLLSQSGETREHFARDWFLTSAGDRIVRVTLTYTRPARKEEK